MPRTKTTLLMAIALMSLTPLCVAKTQKLTGHIIAYDLMKHNDKTSSAVQNSEVIILQTTGPKQKYVKVVVTSSGTTQIDQKYFDGTTPFTVDVFRDHTCDESSPKIITQVSIEQMAAGTYLTTDAFKASPPGKIKSLGCYVAIQTVQKKKKKKK